MIRILFAFLLSTLASGAATLTSPSASYSDVSATITAAARGDTVIVPAGSATWSSTLNLTKGVTLQGAGRTLTLITTSGGKAIQIGPDATALSSGELFSVTGFRFDGNSSALNLIGIEGAVGSATKAFTNLAIGNCQFQNMSTTTSGSGVISSTRQVRGCIFSNIFDRCNVIVKIMGNNDAGEEWANGHWPRVFGTADNLYFESNLIEYSSTYNGTDSGWTESGQGARLVMRYNTWNMANGHHTELWDCHGFQNWPGNGQTGTMISEYYGNTVTGLTGDWIKLRGGWALVHNNIVTGSGGNIQINQYGPADAGGSGCMADVPGASGVYNGEITNHYCWNNNFNGSDASHGSNLPGGECGVVENRNFWFYNSSFNGTTGIGRGTATPSGSATFGVGYWKNSTATPSVDPNIVQAGTFYMATAANTYTAIYTPYTYPHPLAGGAAVGGNTNPIISVSPSAPTWTLASGSSSNKTITVQNVGSNTLTGSVTLTNTIGSAFTISGTGTNYSLAANATTNFTVGYTQPTNAVRSFALLTFTGGGGTVSTCEGGLPKTWVWPLGDSNTRGGSSAGDTNFVAGGYRLKLYQLLTNQLIHCVFVGSTNDNPDYQLPYPNHDGWGGYEIGDLSSGLATYKTALEHAPDFVCLEVGLNDYRHNTAITTATNRLISLIAQLNTNYPAAKIVVAAMNPWENLAATNNAMNTNYNPFIGSLVTNKMNAGTPTYFADMREPYLTVSDVSADNTHFIASGYNKMATNFYNQIVSNSVPVATNGSIIAVSPSALQFYTNAAQATTNLTLTVSNIGTTTLTGSASVSGDSAFVISGTGTNYNIPANSTTNFTVTFTSPTYGHYHATVNCSGGGSIGVNADAAVYPVFPTGSTFYLTNALVESPFTTNTSAVLQTNEANAFVDSGLAMFGFVLASPQVVSFSCSVNAADEGANSFYFTCNGDPTTPANIWDVVPLTSGFETRTVNQRGLAGTNTYFWNLPAGTNFVMLRGREAGTQIKSLTVTGLQTNTVTATAPVRTRIVR
jgi:hypothetical protein